MRVRVDDARLTWAGAVSVEQGEGWAAAWRVPHRDRVLYPQVLLERASMPAGVRLAFRTNSGTLRGTVSPLEECAPIDLCVNGEVMGSQALSGQDRFAFEGLPSEEKLVELWLPQFGAFRLTGLELDDGATLAAHQDRRPKWVTYGSSITQCRAAQSPSYTWPAIVARRRAVDLTCLGYGGQCHLDPMIGRLMRDLPADFLSMCVGINIYGAASLGPRTFKSGIVGFVQIVRERHPETPFVVMSPIFSPPREEQANAVGFTLRAMRDEVVAAVGALRAHGDRNVHYVDGLRVFGEDLGHLLPDELHPNAEGYKLMAEGFLREAVPHFG